MENEKHFNARTTSLSFMLYILLLHIHPQRKTGRGKKKEKIDLLLNNVRILAWKI